MVQMLGAARQDSSCSTYGYSHADYGVSSSYHYVPGPADRGESDERGDDDGSDGGDGDGGDGEGGDGDGDGGDDDHDDGSHNKRPDVVRDVPAPTQKRKKAAEGGPVDPELIPSYGGHVAGRIWRGQDRGLLKCRSRYMALTGWELTDSQAWIYLYFPMFVPPFRHSPEGCNPYMQMFPQIGYKSESKLLNIRLRLYMMTGDEVQWMPYRTQDVCNC
ncbi:hypothetical protein M9H77_11734 [Catharanthus roseus]|uniref:Uncharacterized protein n=1 Tax=Catharanthus roseus TaxID=4058 RepID=A0ACC0BFH1_CATRO|nr:hypothetical protein M9H77_11734 [Catharanthus roseus]